MRKNKMRTTEDLGGAQTEHYTLDFKSAISFGDICGDIKIQHKDDGVVITHEKQDGTVNKVIVKDPHLYVSYRTNMGNNAEE